MVADYDALAAEIERLRALLACAYQLAGYYDAPIRFLDAFALHDEYTKMSPDQIIDELLPIADQPSAAVCDKCLGTGMKSVNLELVPCECGCTGKGAVQPSVCPDCGVAIPPAPDHPAHGVPCPVDGCTTVKGADQPSVRPCTCHPDDNPPVPCPQKFALSECKTAVQAIIDEEMECINEI